MKPGLKENTIWAVFVKTNEQDDLIANVGGCVFKSGFC